MLYPNETDGLNRLDPTYISTSPLVTCLWLSALRRLVQDAASKQADSHSKDVFVPILQSKATVTEEWFGVYFDCIPISPTVASNFFFFLSIFRS